MVELTATLDRVEERGNNRVNIFRTPAFTASGARSRTRVNSTLKGLSNFKIGDTQKITDDTDVPGVSIYEVEVIV